MQTVAQDPRYGRLRIQKSDRTGFVDKPELKKRSVSLSLNGSRRPDVGNSRKSRGDRAVAYVFERQDSMMYTFLQQTPAAPGSMTLIVFLADLVKFWQINVLAFGAYQY